MRFDVILVVIFGVWLLVNSVVLYLTFSYFKKLSKDVNKGNLINLIEKILEREKENSKDITVLAKELKEVKDSGIFHIQKLGFVRFNPFKELGGDHSFAVVLLDGNDTGLILTGLHTRERTRVYIKTIKKGKSDHNLSSDEKRALESALVS